MGSDCVSLLSQQQGLARESQEVEPHVWPEGAMRGGAKGTLSAGVDDWEGRLGRGLERGQSVA